VKSFQVFCDWCELKRFFNRGSPVHRHYQQLFTYFREGRRYRLLSWHVRNRRHEWLDGSVRINGRSHRNNTQ